jgi:hypothetical protein
MTLHWGMSRTSLGCLFMLVLSLCASAQKKAQPTYQQKPGEKAIAADAVKNYVPAAQACDNYGWAAAVEMLLKARQINIAQKDWVMKAYGGYRCISPLAVSEYTGLQRYINDDYALSPNRRIRLETEFTPGAPSAADPYIVAFRAGEPVLLIWKGKPYIWYGVVYDEYVHPVGNRMFEMLELKLLDPLAKTKEAQLVSFFKGKNDAGEIDGVMRIKVNPR